MIDRYVRIGSWIVIVIGFGYICFEIGRWYQQSGFSY